MEMAPLLVFFVESIKTLCMHANQPTCPSLIIFVSANQFNAHLA